MKRIKKFYPIMDLSVGGGSSLRSGVKMVEADDDDEVTLYVLAADYEKLEERVLAWCNSQGHHWYRDGDNWLCCLWGETKPYTKPCDPYCICPCCHGAL